jgi:predicted TIM-barrel enzyme
VQNFPTVGPDRRHLPEANLEETGMSYGLEVEMIRQAPRQGHADHALRVQRRRCSAAMANAGADIIVCHLGLTTGGSIGASTALKLKDCPALVDRLGGGGAGGQSESDHAGPWRAGGDARSDAEFVLKNTSNCHGFYGASSMERLPTEKWH